MADQELEKLQESCIAKLYLCGDNVLKYLENDKEKELEQLRSHVKKYCLYEAYPNVIEKVTEKIKNEFDSSNVEGIEDKFNTYFNTLVRKINVENHHWMVELDKRIKQRTDIAENLDESDLVLTNTNDVLCVCPLTKKPLQDPVRNSFCGHIYERESILSYINIRKNKTLCPVAGCANQQPLHQEHLVTHINTRYHNTQQHAANEVPVYDIDMDSELL